MAKPIVSVIIRAFNSRKYIDYAIESVLAQTFQDFEIVVVDDASTDGTDRILHDYARRDERVRIVRNGSNQGPVKTMNIGLRCASGEFIAVHDADDVSLSHRLETQVDFLRANPDVALMGGGAYFIDEEGQEFRMGTADRMVGEAAREFLESGRAFIHSSVMYRREAIKSIGLYDEFFLYSHDYDMLLRMADRYEIALYEEPLVKWRQLNTGVTGKKKRAQAAFGELARIRIRAHRADRGIDLQQEYERLVSNDVICDDDSRERPLSNSQYYYSIGLQLLERGNIDIARKRFVQALKHRGSPSIMMRTLFFLALSLWPRTVNTRAVQTLRKNL